MNYQELVEVFNKFNVRPGDLDEMGESDEWQEEFAEVYGSERPHWSSKDTEARDKWDEAYCEWSDKREAEFKAAVGEYKQVESYGGEGQGERYFNIYKFEDHDIFVKENGFYTSFDGVEWDDDFQEVRPTSKTVTIYE